MRYTRSYDHELHGMSPAGAWSLAETGRPLKHHHVAENNALLFDATSCFARGRDAPETNFSAFESCSSSGLGTPFTSATAASILRVKKDFPAALLRMAFSGEAMEPLSVRVVWRCVWSRCGVIDLARGVRKHKHVTYLGVLI